MTLSRNIRRGVLLLSLVGATGAGSAALAHSLHVMYGELVVHPDRVVLTIETDGQSLAHWRGAAEPCLEGDALSDALYAQSDALARGVVMRDIAGQPLRVQRIQLPLEKLTASDAAAAKLSYSIEFRGGGDRSLLVMRYRPVVESRMQEQITLVAQGANDDQQELVQLTSGGNVVYLDIRPVAEPVPGGAGDSEQAKTPPRLRVAATTRFSLPKVILSAESEALRATVKLPLSMLRLWITHTTEQPDFLSESERQAITPEVRKLLERAIAVEYEGRTEWPKLTSLEFVTAKPAEDHAQPISIWTSMLVAQLQWAAAPPDDARITWQLFNPGLMAIDVEAAGGRTKRLTSYAPHFPVSELKKQ